MMRPHAGDIVIVDWRAGAKPKEPSKLRPAVIVEDSGLFPEAYPNILVVPMTTDEGLAHRSLSVQIEPDQNNGAQETSWALAHHVTSVSLLRIKLTESKVSLQQLSDIRERIALSIGVDY